MMLIVVFVMLVPWISACPSPCTCSTNVGLTVDCKNKAITSEQLETMEFPTGSIRIDLDTNQLTNIPESKFARIDGLEYLNLNNNDLRTLNENNFAHNTNLKQLHLGNNNLTTIHENTFSNNTKLYWLQLDNNNLITLHENTFAHNTNLERLDLNNNNFRTLHEDIFAHNTNLKFLHLENNNLTTIHENTFVHNINLEKLYLENNPLHCDCRMKNMLLINLVGLGGTCRSPEKMRGKSLNELSNSHVLICTSCATLEPCKNGGECLSLDEVQYECRCKLGYHGNHCELQGLCSTTCHTDATCTSPNTCTCNTGYEGDGTTTCTPICIPQCHSHGVCLTTNKCFCEKGYNGDGITSCEQSEENNTLTITIIGCSVGIIVVVLAICVILYKKRLRRGEMRPNEPSANALTVHDDETEMPQIGEQPSAVSSNELSDDEDIIIAISGKSDPL